MAAILDDLHADHRNFARLLTLLGRQLRVIREEGFADMELLLDMVDYIESYPDLIHHPREDLLFARYLEHHREEREAVLRLMQEHIELKQLTAALRTAVEGVLHDAPIEREAFAAQLEEFIERQRRHLNTEEAEVFPLLARTFDEQDWRSVESNLPDSSDPLFGEQLKQQYEGLYKRITGE
jgi:hemerythrin-like domain-containing protein